MVMDGDPVILHGGLEAKTLTTTSVYNPPEVKEQAPAPRLDKNGSPKRGVELLR